MRARNRYEHEVTTAFARIPLKITVVVLPNYNNNASAIKAQHYYNDNVVSQTVWPLWLRRRSYLIKVFGEIR